MLGNIQTIKLKLFTGLLLLAMLNGCSGSIGQRYIETNTAGDVIALKWPFLYKGKSFSVTASITGPATLSDDTYTLQTFSTGRCD